MYDTQYIRFRFRKSFEKLMFNCNVRELTLHLQMHIFCVPISIYFPYTTQHNVTIFFSLFQEPFTTILYDPARKKEPSLTFQKERDSCLEFFSTWNESDQVDFVEQLLSRMCHYQHGHINSYLRPMLQRDFISLLPSK